jgi:lysophospholipase L1-like esterase
VSTPGADRSEAGLFDQKDETAHVTLKQGESPTNQLSRPAKRRLLYVVAGLVGLIGATYVVPPLHVFRPWVKGEGYVPFWNVVGREFMGEGEQLAKEQRDMKALEELAVVPPSTADTEPLVDPVPTAVPGGSATATFPPHQPGPDDKAPKVLLEDGERLAAFYDKLTLVELGMSGAIARAGQWGDSILGDDGLSHAVRTRLQRRFGDAGHGFHVLGRYNLAYLHRGVHYRDREGWTSRCEIIFKCENDGRYGYGGVSTRSSGGGTARWKTTKEGIGSRVSRFELWYGLAEDGGDFQIKVDGAVQAVVNTKADQVGDGYHVIEVPDGPHEFEVRSSGGAVRGYGVVLERSGPGVVWDSLALIGSYTQRLDYQDQEHIAGQIARRDLDLLVFTLGGNDVQREKTDLYRTMEPFEQEFERVITKFRAGKPGAACLVTSLTDHGERVGAHGVRSRRIVPKLVESQRKVAKARGCAFFDMFQAMGGEGSIERWYRSSPPLAGADLGHPTSEGHEVLASLLYQALMHGYAEYRKGMEGKPLPKLARPSE